MTWKEAAIKILQENGIPMRPEIILENILSKKLKTTDGETPLLTLRTEIYRSCVGHENIDKHTSENIFYEDSRGKYGLYDWIESGNIQQQNFSSNDTSKIYDFTNQLQEIEFPDEDESFFPEGKEIYALHKSKERNQDLINYVKNEKYKIDSDLPCEVCGFSFIKNYGTLGDKFIEAHHVKPLSELTSETVSKPEDIVLVCSNCHKMIHRYRPWLSIESLKSILKKNFLTIRN